MPEGERPTTGQQPPRSLTSARGVPGVDRTGEGLALVTAGVPRAGRVSSLLRGGRDDASGPSHGACEARLTVPQAYA